MLLLRKQGAFPCENRRGEGLNSFKETAPILNISLKRLKCFKKKVKKD